MAVKILIVEDEAITAMDLQRKLQSWGYDVVDISHDGESAIRSAKSYRPDLILMDIVLRGDVDGIEVAEMLKKLDIPIIYLTAHSEKLTMERAKDTDPYGYLIKPFDERELLFSIESAIQRYKSDKQIKKLNRALRMLTECNQAMVRIKNKRELLNEVCRIIVEIGGYKMAWVGWAEKDESKSVKPVAEYGFHEGYLDSIKVSWGDNLYGMGPAGRSIRESTIVTIRHADKDPAFEPWRKKAMEMGFLSIIGLPLRVDGKTVATLAIYSSKRDSFDEEEKELLMELAHDISFYLESRKALKENEKLMKTLQKKEAQLRDVINLSPVGILTCKIEGDDLILVDYNREASSIMNMENLKGKKLEEVFENLKNKDMGDIYRKIIKNECIYDLDEFEYEDRGSTRFYSFRAGKIADKIVSVFFNDITEFINNKKKLAECEERLRLMR